MTISEGLTWQKTLQARYGELVSLRNENSANKTIFRGIKADSTDKIEPLYDVIALDKLITNVSREQRNLNNAIKATNATVQIQGYTMNEAVLGELKAK